MVSDEFGYNSKVEGEVIVTRADAVVNWIRKHSVWPMPMGLACCGIELMATGASRFDIARFGMEVMRFSPRQSDVMIVAGTVTYKMALAVKRIYDQMAEPKWVIAMGACASSGGMYRSYAVLQGIDHLLPVDVYISGCPPRPEALLEGLMRLQQKIETEESGPLRSIVRLDTRYACSRSNVRQLFYRENPYVDFLVDLYNLERFKLIKLIIPVPKSQFRYDRIARGYLERPQNHLEFPFMKWSWFPNSQKTSFTNGMGIISPNCFSCSGINGFFNLTLLRSPTFAWHDPAKISDTNRF